MNINFIGFGNMARAMAKKLVQNSQYHLCASWPSATTHQVQTDVCVHCDNITHLKEANVVILAIKPKHMEEILDEISTDLPSFCLVISVAAGVTLARLSERLPPQTAIVRAMPNIAAAIAQSATPLIANQFVTEQHRALAEDIFSSIGLTTWLNLEEHMDAFTALSGSGPGYVLYFLESMIRAAVSLGLEEDIATQFTLQTARGTLDLLATQELSLEKLRHTVTSPGGTTEAALKILMQHPGLAELMQAALLAAYQRAGMTKLT